MGRGEKRAYRSGSRLTSEKLAPHWRQGRLVTDYRDTVAPFEPRPKPQKRPLRLQGEKVREIGMALHLLRQYGSIMLQPVLGGVPRDFKVCNDEASLTTHFPRELKYSDFVIVAKNLPVV